MKKVFTYLVFIFSSFISFSQTAQTLTINIGGADLSDSLIKRHMLGVIAGPKPNWNSITPDLTTKFQNVGISSIRNNDYNDERLDMAGIFFCGTRPVNASTPQYPKWDCDPQNPIYYNWNASDSQFRNWQAGSFAPFLRIGDEYGNPARQHDYRGPRPNEVDNYIQAAVKVVDRYKSFDGAPNALNGYLDLWTEFPGSTFWDRQTDSFNLFFAQMFDTLKRRNPTLKIGGPGLLESVTKKISAGTTSGVFKSFLDTLKKKNVKPDWLGFHVFSNDLDEYYNAAINYRHVLEGTGPFANYAAGWGGSGSASYFHGVELICDAWGFEQDSTLSKASLDSLYNKQKGGAFVMGVFIALQQADVERAYMYRGIDFGGSPTADSANGFKNMGGIGLFYGDATGSYKSSGYAFKLCSYMQTTYTKKLLTSPNYTASGGAKIWSLAGKTNNGSMAVLLSNPTANSVTVTLQVNGLAPSAAGLTTVNQYKVTNTDLGQTAQPVSGGVVTLAPYTANLVTFAQTATAVNTLILNEAIKTYPNPVKNSCTLAFEKPTSGTVTIYRLTGQAAATHTIKNPVSNYTFATSGLLPGIYVVSIQKSNKERIATQIAVQ